MPKKGAIPLGSLMFLKCILFCPQREILQSCLASRNTRSKYSRFLLNTNLRQSTTSSVQSRSDEHHCKPVAFSVRETAVRKKNPKAYIITVDPQGRAVPSVWKLWSYTLCCYYEYISQWDCIGEAVFGLVRKLSWTWAVAKTDYWHAIWGSHYCVLEIWTLWSAAITDVQLSRTCGR